MNDAGYNFTLSFRATGVATEPTGMSRDLSPRRWPGGHCAAQQRPALGRVPWLPDHADAEALLRDESFPDVVASQTAAAEPATATQATLVRFAQLLEMPAAGVRKNVCSQVFLPRRNLWPHPGVRGFAKYERAGGLPLPLLSLAIAKARATLQPGGLEGVQNRGCAKVHLHRESYPPLPARWRADMIAVTNQSGRAPAVGFRDGPPEAIDSARR